MYNFLPPQNIPLHLPIAASVCLKPWFDNDILKKGLLLLRDETFSSFFLYRNVAAGIFDSDFALYIAFEKTSAIRQGFTLKTAYCELCGFSKEKQWCEHLAALCILSLIQKRRINISPHAAPL